MKRPYNGPVTSRNWINAGTHSNSWMGSLQVVLTFSYNLYEAQCPCFRSLIHYQFSLLFQSITNLTPRSSLLHFLLLVLSFFFQLQWLWLGPKWKSCVAQGKIKPLFQFHLHLQAFGLKNIFTIPWAWIFIIQMQYFGQFFKVHWHIYIKNIYNYI